MIRRPTAARSPPRIVGCCSALGPTASRSSGHRTAPGVGASVAAPLDGATGVASSFAAPARVGCRDGRGVRWHPAGPGQSVLQNGHTEVWGSSGMGKTQFAMSLLGQLSRHSGSRFGIADFKNDYSDDTGFPQFAAAEFLDLWNGGAPYNPLSARRRQRAGNSERRHRTAGCRRRGPPLG